MVRVSFKNTNIAIFVEEGTTLSDCIRLAGFHIETPCNCIGICGKCKVYAIGILSEITVQEKVFINEEKNLRLACLARVIGEIEIELIENGSGLKTINRGDAIAAAAIGQIIKVKIKNFDYESSKPNSETFKYLIDSPFIYEKIAKLEGDKAKDVYGIVYDNALLDIGEYFNNILGVAIDLGTTGISAYLVNLESGEVVNRVSCVNPQTEFGGDVISRISFCINNPDGLEILKKSILHKINNIIMDLTKDYYGIDEVYRVAIAGNTTMLHLFLGVSPISIARAPYRPVFLNKLNFEAVKLVSSSIEMAL